MRRSEFAERFRNRRLSLGAEVASIARETDLARCQQQAQDCAAVKQALASLVSVLAVIIIVIAALWWWQQPESQQVIDCPPHEAGNAWCERMRP